MKESISYTFLLNIIIIFVFVCAAIITGTLSYYKAFKANKIIVESIEKYEGYNCLSKAEISRKLATVGYNTPFSVKCKSSDGHCEADSTFGYKVISENLDFDTNNTNMDNNNSSAITSLIYGEKMNSPYKCERKKVKNEETKWVCTTNKNYQYGVYTYMYTEMPIVSSLLRISLYTKTSTLYEFRNFYVEKSTEENGSGQMTITEVESSLPDLYHKVTENRKTYVSDSKYMQTDLNAKSARDKLKNAILKLYMEASVNPGEFNVEYQLLDILETGASNKRVRIQLMLLKDYSRNKKFDAALAGQIGAYGKDGSTGSNRLRQCGVTPPDYSRID